MLARRQHGHHGFRRRDRIASRRSGAGATVHGVRDGIGAEIEGQHLMSGLHQIGRHARSHVSKTDKGNLRHHCFSRGIVSLDRRYSPRNVIS
jgi:hypothetical protein